MNSNSIIVVEAEPTSQKMSITDSGVKLDIYQYQDFSLDNFLFLQVGTYTIKFTPGVGEQRE